MIVQGVRMLYAYPDVLETRWNCALMLLLFFFFQRGSLLKQDLDL